MTVDPQLIVAELRANDLLTTLQAAVRGDSHWRLRAAVLIREINELQLPPLATKALREADARKRALEMMEDICG